MNRKTAPEPWWELFDRRLSRRQVLAALRDVSALVALGGSGSCAFPRASAPYRFSRDPFSFGVASGDPDHRSVVLWTRFDRMAVEEAGLTERAAELRWELAADEGFRSIVSSGTCEASPGLGHSVHVEAAGLRPGADYWYRFRAGGVDSPIGRTRTAPGPDETNERLRFAFASCQNYEHGYFTALRHLAEERVDVVFHLGDYIYEARFSSPDPFPREHEAEEVATLEEYRGRYERYRRDPDLQAAHASAPWVVTFDDHEVDNNWADMHGEDHAPIEAFALRRAAAFQAYYEFMPLRPLSRPKGPDIRVYRSLPYGSLASFFVLDTRQHRTDQPCGDRTKVRCEEAFDPAATMMGAEQEEWLFRSLAASPARWNIMANQVMVSSLARDEGGELAYSMDRWDGYVEAQNRFTGFLGGGQVSNPVILTGDIHSNWIADVKRDFGDPGSPSVAAEFVGTSLSSGGDGRDGGDALPAIQSLNPHIHHFDARRGYVVVEASASQLTAHYRRVGFVTRRGAPVETSVRYVVEPGVPGTRPA